MSSTVKKLIKSGGGVCATLRDSAGRTPLHYLVDKLFVLAPLRHDDSASILKTLVRHGTDVNARDNNGQTALHITIQMGLARSEPHKSWEDLLAMTSLLLNFADVNMDDKFGSTALHYLAKGNPSDNNIIAKEAISAITLILDKGGNINSRDMDQSTPLHGVLGRPHAQSVQYALELAKFMISQGADIDAMDKHGETPLFCAIQAAVYFSDHSNYADACLQLIDSGAKNLDATSNEGSTMLHYAARIPPSESTQALLETFGRLRYRYQCEG